MKNTLNSLETYYDKDLTLLLEVYADGKSLNEMVEATGITNMRIRNILAVLNLRLKKKFRAHDLTILNTRLADDVKDYTDGLVDTLNTDLSLIQNELHKNSKTIQGLRDSNLLLRRTIREANRAEAFDDLLLADIRQQFDSLEENSVTINKVPASEEGTTLLVLSDLHFGEVIKPDTTNGANVFDNAICKSRVEQVVQRLCTSSWCTDTLNVYLLGDILNGQIHSADLKGEVPVMASIVEFARFLGDVFTALNKAFNSVNIIMINGNHSILNDVQKTYQKTYDMEYILFNMLQLQLPSDIPMRYSNTGYAVDNVHGHDIGLFHGDTVRGYDGSAGTSAYKVQNIIECLYETTVTSLISGHTHKAKTIANQWGGLNIVNGSLTGIGEYGLTSGFDTIYPSQTIARIDPYGQWQEVVQVKV